MNAPESIQSIPTTIGEPFDGGFYAGCFHVGPDLFALVVSPAAGELKPQRWGNARKLVDGALSYSDGRANTNAMANAKCKLAEAVLELDIGGIRDWYLPARDELELLYRHFKPTTRETWAWRNGDNPSSLPPGYPYTKGHPQTTVASFREGGADALQEAIYWSSTQYAPDAAYAWAQLFNYGNQSYARKDGEFRARAVRRVAIR